MSKITRRRLGAALAVAGVVWSAAGHAQRYPEKPITIVVAYPPGSDTDVMARPYKGVAPSVTDVVAGHIPVALVTIGPVRQYLKAGKLTAIAVADPDRTPFLPNVPSIAESGFPDVRLCAWNAFFALAAWSAVPAGGSPAKLGARVAADYRQLGRLIDELKIQAD